jgi:hypothetical protein
VSNLDEKTERRTQGVVLRRRRRVRLVTKKKALHKPRDFDDLNQRLAV